MSASIRVVDKGANRVLAAMRERGPVVRVGVIGPKGEAPKEGGKSSATVAQVAAYNHEGTEHIPARPFISQWFDENEADNLAFARKLAAERIGGRLPLLRCLALMGQRAVGGIQKMIATGGFAANAESTLKKKAPKTKPLINTGQLRSSITYEILETGE